MPSSNSVETQARVSVVKICGVQDVDSALVAAQAGASFIGMIFVPKSKRCITAEKGNEIATALAKFASDKPDAESKAFSMADDIVAMSKTDESQTWFQKEATRLEQLIIRSKRPLTVGVFMNQPLDEVNRIATEANLDLIQLHGDESWEDVKLCCKPVIKVMHVSKDSTAQSILTQLKPNLASVVLLDTKVKGGSGGLGITFDWNVAAQLSTFVPVMVAGGLTPVNVSDAINTVTTATTLNSSIWQPGQAWGVDVSSGTETNGVKDHTKITAFVYNARNISTSTSAL